MSGLIARDQPAHGGSKSSRRVFDRLRREDFFPLFQPAEFPLHQMLLNFAAFAHMTFLVKSVEPDPLGM